MALTKAQPLEPIESLGEAGAWLMSDEGNSALLEQVHESYHNQFVKCVNVKVPLAEEIEMLRLCNVYAETIVNAQKLHGRHYHHDAFCPATKEKPYSPFKPIKDHIQTFKEALERAETIAARMPHDGGAHAEYDIAKQQFMREGLLLGGALAHARNYLRTYQETHTDIKDAPSIVVAQYLDGLYGKAIDYVAHIQDRFLNAPTVATETSLPSNLVTSDELMAARIAKSKGKKHLEEWKR